MACAMPEWIEVRITTYSYLFAKLPPPYSSIFLHLQFFITDPSGIYSIVRHNIDSSSEKYELLQRLTVYGNG